MKACCELLREQRVRPSLIVPSGCSGSLIISSQFGKQPLGMEESRNTTNGIILGLISSNTRTHAHTPARAHSPRHTRQTQSSVYAVRTMSLQQRPCLPGFQLEVLEDLSDNTCINGSVGVSVGCHFLSKCQTHQMSRWADEF